MKAAPVVSLWRAPFTLGTPEQRIHAPGTRVSEIVSAARLSLPKHFEARGVVMIGAAPVPRAMWPHVRIKAGEVITLHMPLQGGGDGGGKQVLGLVAALALTVATAGIASGALAPVLGAGFASGTLGASALAAGVAITGSLILGALSPPPALGEGVGAQAAGERLEPAAVEGNVLEPNAAIPRVLGTRRVFPPLVAEPFIELVGQDEVVEAVYALAGPHRLEDIRLGDADIAVPADDITDLQIETREGLAGDAPLQLAARQGRSRDVNVEMSTHVTDPTDGSVLDPAESNPLPVWHAVATRNAPDENALQLRLDGLILSSDDTVDIRVPLRMRLRKRGASAWRYLPEIHYMNRTQSPRRLQIRLLWGEAYSDNLPVPPSAQGFVMARKQVPAQNVQPFGASFSADSYFAATGGDVFEAGTASTTGVRNLLLYADRVDVYLDDASWSRGEYEIEIRRGAAFKDSDFASATYVFGGGSDILDFFGRRQSGAMPLSRDGLLDRLGLVRLINIWNHRPVAAGGNALIALRAKNRRVERLSARASGYVYDYHGDKGTWSHFTTTSNPAAHFRDVLRGALNFDPIPQAIIDDDALVDWRSRCITKGYTCDFVAEGLRTADALRLIASCGFARPTQSELWGVAQDYDRSADAPVQIFTPRNSNGFAWRRAFARLPSGFRVNFRDVDRDYQRRQITVRRAGADAAEARLEQVTYDGIVSEQEIVRRAEFDLRQAELRAAFYRLTAPAEAIVCRRGSLVGVQHDVLVRHHGAARILSTTVNGGNVEKLLLDAPVEVRNEPDMPNVSDMLALTDMLNVGAQSAVAIRRTDGTVTIHELSDATGETDEITLASPVSDDTNAGGPFDAGSISDIGPGALVSIGQLGSEYRRLIVTEITPQADLVAQITMVDEAPALTAGLASFAPLPSTPTVQQAGSSANVLIYEVTGWTVGDEDDARYWVAGVSSWSGTAGLAAPIVEADLGNGEFDHVMEPGKFIGIDSGGSGVYAGLWCKRIPRDTGTGSKRLRVTWGAGMNGNAITSWIARDLTSDAPHSTDSGGSGSGVIAGLSRSFVFAQATVGSAASSWGNISKQHENQYDGSTQFGWHTGASGLLNDTGDATIDFPSDAVASVVAAYR